MVVCIYIYIYIHVIAGSSDKLRATEGDPGLISPSLSPSLSLSLSLYIYI